MENIERDLAPFIEERLQTQLIDLKASKEYNNIKNEYDNLYNELIKILNSSTRNF